MDKTRKKTQREKVLDYVRDYGSIDRLSALVDLGIFELPARIVELEADGHTFRRRSKRVKVRDGSEVRVVEYSLED